MKTILGLCLLALAVMAETDLKQLDKLIHEGSNTFTSKMFTEVLKKNPKKSFVMSAFSVMTPLAQLGLASVGESHDELLEAIGMPNDDVTKEAFAAINAKVRSIKGVTLKSASKIYVAQQYELNDEFAATTRSTFDSEVQNIDFGKPAIAAKEVNTWVEEQTNNRIKDLVDPDSIGDDTRALLVNALYFKGEWDAQFNKDQTTERDFHVNKVDTVKVDMMYRKGDYRYTDSRELKAQIVEIPYKGRETSLVVVLPHDIEGIAELEEKLKNLTTLEVATNSMYSQELNLYLPKFKIETTTDLKEILGEMNLKRMFDPTQARLNNLLKEIKDGLYIDSARQKAFIEVNEEGAEAGAANVFGISYLSAYVPAPPIEFKADHPFLFYLLEGNNVLFNGGFYQ